MCFLSKNDMKFAIITDGFNGSSSSLVEAMLKGGYNVDFYNILYTSQNVHELESYSIGDTSRKIGVTQIKVFDKEGLSRFEKFKDKLNFYVVRCLGLPNGKRFLDKVKQTISKIVQHYLLRKLIYNSYDFVNVVGQTPFSFSLSIYLKKKGVNVVHSVHEVLKNHLNEIELNEGVCKIIEENVKINVFSKKSAEDLLMASHLKQNDFTVIPFGLFTGYCEYSDVEIKEIKDVDNYILYYGYIHPYKGLDVLYDAVIQMSQNNTKVVVAGKGADPVMDRMKKDERFIVLNRWIGNAELVTLIKKCRFVVCPYKSASQSGIPQTVFNFDKPIVATDIDSFQEIIITGVNGAIVERENPLSLRSAIEKMYEENGEYERCVFNIKKYRETESEENWLHISQKYVDAYSLK